MYLTTATWKSCREMNFCMEAAFTSVELIPKHLQIPRHCIGIHMNIQTCIREREVYQRDFKVIGDNHNHWVRLSHNSQFTCISIGIGKSLQPSICIGMNPQGRISKAYRLNKVSTCYFTRGESTQFARMT